MSTPPGQQPPPPQQPPGGPPPQRPAGGPPPQRPAGGSSPQEKKQSNVSVGQILAGILFVLVIVFIIENSQDVKIRFIVGPKVEVPVFVALLIAAVVGALISWLMRIRRQHKHKPDKQAK